MVKGRLAVILCWLALGGLLATQAAAAPGPLTDQEKYVLQQVATGRFADLKAQFGEQEKNRRVSGPFLEDLLTGTLENKIHRKGVMIKNAVVREPLDLKSVEVPFDVQLKKCEFLEVVNFQDSLFEKNLRMDGCRFAKEAHFLKMTVKKSAYFTRAIFQGRANFNGINIGSSLNMDFTKFASNKKTYFNSSKIGKSAYFLKSVFCGPLEFRRAFVGEELNFGAELEGAKLEQVDFSDSTIGFYFSLRDTTITGPAKFVGLKVGLDLYLTKATIAAAEFTGADIGHDFIAREARFRGPSKSSPDPFYNYAAIFPDMKVGHVANFEDAVFTDQVNFGRMDVGLQLEADRARFEDEEQPVNAIGLKVGTIAYFQDVEFKGPVDFTGARINGVFNAAGAKFKFQSTVEGKIGANFNGMQVGQLAQFTDAEFRGPVNFSSTRVGGKLVTKVKEGTILEGAVFGDDETPGQVRFTDAILTDLVLHGSSGTPLRISTLDLRRLRVNRDFSLENGIIDDLKAGTLQVGGDLSIQTAWIDNFEAANLTVKGGLSIKSACIVKWQAENLVVDDRGFFENLLITQKADLGYSTFGTLNLQMDIDDWPPQQIELEKMAGADNREEAKVIKEAGLILDGIEYKELLPKETQKDRKKLIAWIDQSRFDKGNYIKLENYFANQGYESEADNVFISMRDRELGQIDETSWYNNWLVWLGRLPARILWGKLAGYGHKPFRTFWLGLGIILAGAIFLFNPKYLQVKYFQNWHLDYQLTPVTILKEAIKKDGGSFNFAEMKQLFKLWLFRFIISFDQFIPLIDLELSKNWQPPNLSFRAWCFLYFQKISGWILVPIGLAAIYSQFK